MIEPDGQLHDFFLGAHAPPLTEQEVNKVHEIWLRLTNIPGGHNFHHRTWSRFRLDLLEREISGKEWKEIMAQVGRSADRGASFDRHLNARGDLFEALSRQHKTPWSGACLPNVQASSDYL